MACSFPGSCQALVIVSLAGVVRADKAADEMTKEGHRACGISDWDCDAESNVLR